MADENFSGEDDLIPAAGETVENSQVDASEDDRGDGLPDDVGLDSGPGEGSGDEDATDEHADGDAEEGGSAEGAGEGAVSHRKGGVQKRIDKLTAEKYEEKAAREEAEKRAAELQARLEELETMSQLELPNGASGKQDGEPREDDFDDYSDYVKAMISWQADQVAAQRVKEYHQHNLQYQRQAILEAKLQSGREKYDDFDKVVRDPNLPLTQTVIDAASASAHTADILYHIAKNPVEAARLAGLSPMAVAVEIGKLDASLSSQTGARQQAQTNNAPPVSNAPPPINPVSGGGNTRPKSVYDENLSYEEYVRLRRESGNV